MPTWAPSHEVTAALLDCRIVSWFAAPIGTGGRVALGLGVAAQIALCFWLRHDYAGAWAAASLGPTPLVLGQIICSLPYLMIVGGAVLLGSPGLGLKVSRLWGLAWWLAEVVTLPLMLVVVFVNRVGGGLAGGVP